FLGEEFTPPAAVTPASDPEPSPPPSPRGRGGKPEPSPPSSRARVRRQRLPPTSRKGRGGKVTHEGVRVEYAVGRSARRRQTLSRSVQPDGRVRVAVPMATTVAEIEAFVAKHAAWLVKRLAARAAAPPRPRMETGALLQFFDRTLEL